MTKYLVIISFAFSCCQLSAQSVLSTQNNIGTSSLVKNSLIKGNCRNVTNIKALGDEDLSIGRFANGEDIIGISRGIILSTGDIDLAQGPNISSESSFTVNSAEENDDDLDQLATSTLYDVTGIEFDFIPLSDNVSFTYVFASEEYCEFVGTSFNDVFGFFVSGPGINGSYENNAINVASLINTNQDVSINNVNHLQNQEFYVDNVTNLDAEACNIMSNPAAEDFIEFDGFTVPLKATFSVVPCETYTIRLVIADVGDPNLDSAVFLEANSFDLGEQVNLSAEVPGMDEPIAYETCTDAQFVFTRSALSDFSEDITVDFSISPDSDAINGIDFLEIPLSITIAAGDTSFILPIVLIDDGIAEGPEKLKLNIPYDCDCIDPVFNEIIIQDPSSLSANFDELIVCENQAFQITPNITEGAAPYTFLWEDGSLSDTLETSVFESTQFSVSITDICGSTSIAIADVQVQPAPTANLMGVYDLCEIKASGIPVQIEGSPPWTLIYSIEGIEQTPIENIQSNLVYIPAPSTGNYSLTALLSTNCEGIVLGSATVDSNIEVEFQLSQPSCFNKKDGKIEIIAFEAEAPYSMEWNFETVDNFLLENLGEGSYTLTLVDANGCQFEKTISLLGESQDIDDCIPIYIPNVFSPDADGNNDSFSIFYGEDSGITQILSFQVFDRWGSLLFEEYNFTPESGTPIWQGRFRNELLDSGVYVYKFLLQFEDGTEKFLSGDVSLIR